MHGAPPDLVPINAAPPPVPDPELEASSLRRGPTVGVLSDGELERIRVAALRVLEDLGVRVGSSSVIRRLKSAGARVSADRVHLPRLAIEGALGRAPRGFVLAARDPSADLHVGAGDGWLGTGGPAGLAVDLQTGERRNGHLRDIADAARLADAVPSFGYLGPCVGALDVPVAVRPLRELHVRLANTSKHVQIEVPADRPAAEALAEIARLVAGAELRDRPVVSAVLPVASPLAMDGRPLEAALTLAEAGMPCGVVAEPIAGVTAPATLAGALVMALANALAGVVSLQLLAPGASSFLGTRALGVHVGERGSSPGGPADPLFQMAWTQLVGSFDLPAHVGAFATGSRTSDWQAGIEVGLSATASWMTCPDLLAAAGTRDGGRIFSPVAMLLDAELFDLVRRVPLGFGTDDEALAVELIERVGPGGHFLGETHTLRHMREAWMSRFMDTDTWEAWEEAGRPQPSERARAEALELLEASGPRLLEPAVEDRIREVIAEHERQR